jgi:hypothetical protein
MAESRIICIRIGSQPGGRAHFYVSAPLDPGIGKSQSGFAVLHDTDQNAMLGHVVYRRLRA